MSQFGGAEYQTDIDILQFFIQNLSVSKLVLKQKSFWIYLSYEHTSQFEDNKNKYGSNIIRFFI